MSYVALITALKGSASSGNWGHAGRPGKRGGSAPKSGVGAAMSLRTGRDAEVRQTAAKRKPDAPAFKIPVNQDTVTYVENRIKSDYDSKTIEDALNNLKAMVDGQPVSMRVPSDVILAILTDDKFKNQHEVPHSNGYFNPMVRLDAERNAFGAALSQPSELPVYGYINTFAKSYTPMVDNYGEIRIDFKDDIKNRTTITSADSLTMFSYKKGAATPLNNVGMASLDNNVDEYASYSPSYGYVEAQIHGGLTSKDIKRVYLPKDIRHYTTVTAKLDSLGIPYTTVDNTSDNLDSL